MESLIRELPLSDRAIQLIEEATLKVYRHYFDIDSAGRPQVEQWIGDMPRVAAESGENSWTWLIKCIRRDFRADRAIGDPIADGESHDFSAFVEQVKRIEITLLPDRIRVQIAQELEKTINSMIPSSNRVQGRQRKKLVKRSVRIMGERAAICCEIRWDDECNNGHNTFSVTGDVWKNNRIGSDSAYITGGCIHDHIQKHFAEVRPMIRYHLVNADAPMHYMANCSYFLKQGNYDSARSTAIWPEVEDGQLEWLEKTGNLRTVLLARIPDVMESFKAGLKELCPDFNY